VEHGTFLYSLARLEVRSVMSTLARIRPACHGPLRRIIRDLRRQAYDQIPKRERGTSHEHFVRDALCVLALFVEQREASQVRTVDLPERWVRRARAAQAYFPEAMSAIRSRRRELEQELAIKHGFEGQTK
jgi:hypothetical protein